MNPKTIRVLIMFTMAYVAGLPTATARQDDQIDRSRASYAAFYNYSDQGELTLQAQVLGTVRYPGLYEVRVGTRFTELLSVAGGPAISERFRQNRRTIKVKLFRFQGGDRVLLLETSASNSLDLTGPDPEILSGDILVVESEIRQGFSWRDVFPVVGAIASVTLIVDRLATR